MRYLPVLLLLLLFTPALAEDGHETFDRVWDLVEEKFYDPKLNGLDPKAIRAEAKLELEGVTDPETVSSVVNGYLKRLNASHTHLFSSREPDYYELLDVFYFGSYEKQIKKRFQGDAPHYHGILIHEKDGAIVDVVPGGPADKAGLQKGDKILSADGRPYHPIDSFRDKIGQPVELLVSRGDGTLDIVVHPEEIYPRQAFLRSIEESARVIDGHLYDIGYVRMWSYAGEAYHEALVKVLLTKLADADGLILDLRGRWGGAQPQYIELFAPTPKLVFTQQDGEGFETEGSVWNKPVGLLIDSTVSSGKELLAYGFRRNSLGPLIGERTQGSLLGGSLHLLPGGYALYLATVDVQVDGQRLEGLGVGPTYPQTPDPDQAAGPLKLEIFQRDLAWRADLDQSTRSRNSSGWDTIDQDNTEWAKKVVKTMGWPKADFVGKDSAKLFWLIVQHTPDLAFQEDCLGLMTRAVEEGQASATDHAYLYDRVQMHNKRPQLYGTQLYAEDGGDLKLWIVEDPEDLDKRRDDLDLQPIAEYLKLFGIEGYESLEDVMHKPTPQPARP
jgi:carboxyl-terminal processing protease